MKNLNYVAGTLAIGSSALTLGDAASPPASMIIGYGRNSAVATLVSSNSFTAYLGGTTVYIGYASNQPDVTGTLDLRNAVPTQTSFACGDLYLGMDAGVASGHGYLYLNDAGGAITNLAVRSLYFGNGTLTLNNGASIAIGSSTNSGNLTVGRSRNGGSATLVPTGPFTAYLGTGTVTIGQATYMGDVTGTLDLRNATLSQDTFACNTLNVGIPAMYNNGIGTLRLDDGGGVITNLVVRSLYFGNGTLIMKNGAGIAIGSSTNRGNLTVGWIAYNSGTGVATWAPTGGTFSAYVTNMILGQVNGAKSVVGTLNLTNTTLQTLDVSGTATIGHSGSGKGIVYLGPGNASFTNLVIAANSTVTGSLLNLRGTTLTVGNSLSNTFNVRAGYGSLTLDFSDPATRLKVYGDWQASGPATNIATYLADGRLVITNGAASVAYDGTYSIISAVPEISNDGGASNLAPTSATLSGYLAGTGAAPAYVWMYWGQTDGGTNKGSWTASEYFGQMPVGQFSTNLSGLASGARYYYRCYGSNSIGDAWAPASTDFKTICAPSIVNTAATQVTGIKARLNGILTNGSQAYVTMYWGTTDGGASASAWGHTNGLGLLNEGGFWLSATGLTVGVTYYYRCYASNVAATAWAPDTTNFMAWDIAGPGQTWSGGGGANDDWTFGENWVGGVFPGRPAWSTITFNDSDVGNTNVMDTDWTLAGGLTVANTSGKHTTDLGGNTLSITNGDVKVGYDVNGSSITFANGKLIVGAALPLNVYVGYNASAGAASGTLTVNSSFAGNLSSVYAGYQLGAGTFDLRGAVVTQTTFACANRLVLGTDMVGDWYTGSGAMYLNDKNGVIKRLEVGNLYFR